MSSGSTEHSLGRRGTRRRTIGLVLLIAGIAGIAGFLYTIQMSTPDDPAAPRAATATARRDDSPQRDPYLPTSQTQFTSMIESFIPGYNSADTEIRKTNVRFARRDAIARYFAASGGLRFQGWVGEVHDLRTESDGEASLTITLKGSRTVIRTWNNSFSDSSSHTMISRADRLYPSLMEIKNGDVVTVSGAFIVDGSGRDYVRELSMTEEGAMTSPEFLVRFSQIGNQSQ